MCLDILKNPVSALEKAKKSKNTNKSIIVLAESAILFALTSIVAIMKGTGFAPASYSLVAVSAIIIFLVILIFSMIIGYAMKIIVNILGGKGGYYEGLTAISYSLMPVSVAVFVSSLLSLVTGGPIIGIIVLIIGFASGISLLYRSIKELFKTDMLTAFIAVSVLILVLFVASSISFGLSLFNLSALGGI
ncbi:MAG: YIP1 family protein [Candidatus Aenigmarchaeota archaeon]|nr:YIP1 family protein [Candidatus Aenigmarchaeota archaeon]